MSKHDDWGQAPQQPEEPYNKRMEDYLGPGGWDTPWEEEPAFQSPEARKPRVSKLAKKVGAVASGIILSVGAGVGMERALNDDGDPSGPSSTSQSGELLADDVDFDAFESNPAVPEDVIADIDRAVSKDACITKVTTEEISAIYSRVFAERALPSTPDELNAQANHVIERLESATKDITFVGLTPEQQQFVEQEKGTYSGSYDSYRDTLLAYLNQFDIKIVDGWDDKTEISPGIYGEQLSNMHSMTETELQNSSAVRIQIINMLETFANVPKDVIERSGLSVVVLGDMSGQNELGAALRGTGVMTIDASSNPGESTLDAELRYDKTVATHELSHIADSTMCEIVLFGAYVDDEGFSSLNDAFKYGPESVEQLSIRGITNDQYTSLRADQPYAAAVTREYGANNENEDKATILGEAIMYAPGADALFTHENADPTIVYEKASMLIARIAEKNPQVAEYYISVLQAAQVEALAESMLGPLFDEQFELINELDQKGIIDPEQDPAYQDLMEKLEAVEAIATQLEDSLGSTTE